MEKLLTADEVLERVPVDRKTLDNLEKRGEFPSRKRVGSRIFWRESDINEYIAKKS